MSGNGGCCGMVAGVSCSVETTVFLVLDRPMVVYHQREETAWDQHLLRTRAVENRVAHQREV